MSVVYVYALVDAAARAGRARAAAPRSIRAGGRRIELIRVERLDAAVERLDDSPALSEASLRAQHELVVALGRRFDAILPVRFGAVLTEQDLEHTLRVHQARLRLALDTVRGREQMTARIIGKPETASGPPPGRRTGTAYLADRRRVLRGGKTPLVTRLRRAVKPVVAGERVEPGQGRIRATIHHLIARGHAADYRSLVSESIGRLPSHDEVIVSGPWPPFAFTPDLLS